MKIPHYTMIVGGAAIAAVGVLVALGAGATHSWGNYHWARTANPFTLKLGDNVSTEWDAYLAVASADWSASSVLETIIVTGGTRPKTCKPVPGRIEVCNAQYGRNGWIGLAQIWVSGSHITQAVAKMNDTYFSRTPYNAPSWRQFVMCQELGHTFGLDHQNENFSDPNLGTCMDYTNDPDGPPSNEHPDAHDYEQLALIYAHTDSSTTVGQALPKGNGALLQDLEHPSEWGKVIRTSANGKPSLFEQDLGNGKKVFTFVIWADR